MSARLQFSWLDSKASSEDGTDPSVVTPSPGGSAVVMQQCREKGEGELRARAAGWSAWGAGHRAGGLGWETLDTCFFLHTTSKSSFLLPGRTCRSVARPGGCDSSSSISASSSSSSSSPHQPSSSIPWTCSMSHGLWRASRYFPGPFASVSEGSAFQHLSMAGTEPQLGAGPCR